MPVPSSPAAPRRLTDREALFRQRARARRQGWCDLAHALAADEIEDRLAEVNRRFTAPAVVTGAPDFWAARMPGARVVPDDAVLDLEPAAHDLVLHVMALHWTDDPVGQLIQCARALRPDGLLIAVAPGGDTLAPLRAALATAEVELTGGLSPRVVPMGELRDMGALLSRAGLALPVADMVRVNLSYRDPLALMREVRAMGEGNALEGRLRRPTRRAVIARAAALLAEGSPDPDDPSRVLAPLELVFLTGWAPDASQPQPLRPGSARTPLAAALNATRTE